MDKSSSDSSDEELIPKNKKIEKPVESVKKEIKTMQQLSEETWDIGMFKKIKVSSYKDKYYIDIREYFFDKNGQPNPTKKGINLPLNELPFLIKIL